MTEAKRSSLSSIAVGVISGLLSALGVLYASTTTYFNKYRDQDIEFAKIAISILASKEEGGNEFGRRFAINLLEKSTDIKLDDETKSAWSKTGNIYLNKELLDLFSRSSSSGSFSGGSFSGGSSSGPSSSGFQDTTGIPKRNGG